jgi:hypothetical protein
VADDSLFQLTLVQTGEGDVRETVPEDPLVSFEERLPDAFRATSGLAFLVLEVVTVEQQLPSITQRNEIGCRDLRPGELEDEFLVLDEDVPDLIWRQQ